ncbi:autotransporter assembly complex protein TamA [Allorhizobium terrae]|uniref:Outer membrane protein assembly factor n=1 Tax=Allorhizobium terrae TaxID=1848972 RepID=A0A4V3W868_9HYPH|nr:autotransporter assembly complex family protein [Allorhizobium terrae]THF50092.1 outer membrane protein assembly factor [Allorhizobium terrae]
MQAHAFTIFGLTLWGENKAVTDVIDPVRYDVTFHTPQASKDLKNALENSSMLLQDKSKPVSGDLGVVIKANEDRERLLATLYENSYYGGVITITINGTPLDSLPPNPTFSRNTPVAVDVTVEPGPLFTLRDVRLTDDAQNLNPATYDLVVGKPAGSLAIIKAANKMLDDIKANSQPLAQIAKRDVVADHANNTIDVTIAIKSGPVAPLGPVTVSGNKAVNAGFIQKYSRLNAGQPYKPEDLRKATDRLRKLGVFSSITVNQADKLDANGAIPLDIRVSEAKFRYFGAGATYSTIDGAGIQGYWGHRNLFGRAESLRVDGSVSGFGKSAGGSDLDYAAGISFAKPGFLLPSGTLDASIKAATLSTDSYNTDTITGRLGYSYELTDVDTVSVGTSLQFARVNDAFGRNNYLTFSVPLDYARDTRDDKLNPTEGYHATLSAAPSYEFRNGTIFSNAEGSISGYYGLGMEDHVVLAGKLAAGTLFSNGDLVDIPANRRFFSGGGGSVRGYAYQGISPRNSADKATGGLSYVTASVEARVHITDSIGLVPFLDVGTVSDSQVPDFSNIKAGAGLGLRYATPFGPIRLDVALPLNPYPKGDKYGIYVGIGQSF